MKRSEIEKMSVDEKLQAMEALWSALDEVKRRKLLWVKKRAKS